MRSGTKINGLVFMGEGAYNFGHAPCRGVWSPGQQSMMNELPLAMQQEISMSDIYPTIVQV